MADSGQAKRKSAFQAACLVQRGVRPAGVLHVRGGWDAVMEGE